MLPPDCESYRVCSTQRQTLERTRIHRQTTAKDVWLEPDAITRNEWCFQMPLLNNSPRRFSIAAGLVLAVTLSTFLNGCSQDSETPPTMTAIEEIAAIEAAEREKEKLPDSYKADKLNPVDMEALNRKKEAAAKLPPDIPATGTYEVEFDTDVGKFVVTVNREWAPRGADRFYKLVKDSFYDKAGFFRVVPDFMVQWGLAADPADTKKWDVNIQDDPVLKSNQRGYITFAKTGMPNSRSTQVFINYKDNSFLDGQGFSPFGRVRSGMDVVDKISAAHGESPDQGQLREYGNEYLSNKFTQITYIRSAKFLLDDLATEASAETPDSSEAESTEGADAE